MKSHMLRCEITYGEKSHMLIVIIAAAAVLPRTSPMSLQSAATPLNPAALHRPPPKPATNYWHSSALVRLRRTRIFDYNRAFETVIAMHAAHPTLNRRTLLLLVRALQRLLDHWHTLHAYGEQLDRELLASQAAAAAQIEARRLSEARHADEKKSVEVKGRGAKRRLFSVSGKGRRGSVQTVYGTRFLSKVKADAATAARCRRLGITSSAIMDMKRSLRSAAPHEKNPKPPQQQLNGATLHLALNCARLSHTATADEHVHSNGNLNLLPYQNGDAAPLGASPPPPAARAPATPLIPVIVVPLNGVRSRFDRTRATPEQHSKMKAILREWTCAPNETPAQPLGTGLDDARSTLVADALAPAPEEKPVPPAILALRPPRKHEPGFGIDPVTGERNPTIEKQHLFDTRQFRVLHERFAPPPPKRVRPLCPLTFIYGEHATLSHPIFNAPRQEHDDSASRLCRRPSKAPAHSSSSDVSNSLRTPLAPGSPPTPNSKLFCVPAEHSTSSSTSMDTDALEALAARRRSLPMLMGGAGVGVGARAALDAQLSSISEPSEAVDPAITSRPARLLRRAELRDGPLERSGLACASNASTCSPEPESKSKPLAETPEQLSPQRHSRRRMSTNRSLACMLSSMKQQCGVRPGTRAFDRLRSASPDSAEHSASATEAAGAASLEPPAASSASSTSASASATRRSTRLAVARATSFASNPLSIASDSKRCVRPEATSSRSSTPVANAPTPLSSCSSSALLSSALCIPSRNSSSSQATGASSASFSSRTSSIRTRSTANKQATATADAAAAASALVVTPPSSLASDSPPRARRSHQMVPSSRRLSSSSSTSSSSNSNQVERAGSKGRSSCASRYSLRRSLLHIGPPSASASSSASSFARRGAAFASLSTSSAEPAFGALL